MGCIVSRPNGAPRGALPNEVELARRAERTMGPTDPLAIKLLLLGTGGGGKTTFRKQLRSIYTGFSVVQRKEIIPIIFDNMITDVKTICLYLREQVGGLQETQPELSNAVVVVEAVAEEEHLALNERLVDALLLVWNHSITQDLLKNRSIQVQECNYEFFSQLKSYPTWGGPSWIPTVEDCVRARVRSTGVAEEHFILDGVTFKIFDAGGQRAERRKWMHFFDKVNSVLFMTSLTSYCETLFEDMEQNGLVEALDLFDSISNSKWFSRTPFMLLFNKRDMLEKTLVQQRIHLNVSGLFPSAPDTFECNEAIEYLTHLFISRRKPLDPPVENPDSLNYVHVTTAVSRESVQLVFDTCKAIIIRQALSKSGFSAIV